MAAAPVRLKRRSEFLSVAAAGRKVARRSLILQARRRGNDGLGARVGFTVSRKVGNAVERNRARRRLRAAAEAVLPRCAAPDHDYVIIGRRDTLGRSFPDLLRDLESAMTRISAPAVHRQGADRA